MKKFLPIFLICALLAPAQAKNTKPQSLVLNTLEQELKREFKQLKKATPPVYFMSYQITERDNFYLDATLGTISSEQTIKDAFLDVDIRVGNQKLDNTRKIKLLDIDNLANYSNKNPFLIKVSLNDMAALKNSLWLTTDLAAKAAQEQYLKVLNNTKTAAERNDTSDDFSKTPQKPSQYIANMPEININIPELKTELENLSVLMKGYDFIYSSSVDFYLVKETNYFVNSEGAKIKEPRVLIRLSYKLNSRNKDGMQLSRTNSYDAITMADLPDQDKIKQDILKSIEELKQLQNAPSADTFHGPVILKNRAAGVFFHEILGHRVEGHRQKDDDYIYIDDEDYEPIEFFGKPALFTEERKTDADIPNGLHYYQLRSSDDGSNPYATVEKIVSVNFSGSVITSDPIDLGKNGYVELGEENTPNFIGGDDITLDKYIEIVGNGLDFSDQNDGMGGIK